MKPVAGGRQASIDVLRAVAIMLMVVVHFVENLSGWYGEADNVFAGVHRVWWLPTGFAAPIFTFLTGVSYRLWLDLQWRRGRSDEAIAKGTVRRGLLLVGEPGTAKSITAPRTCRSWPTTSTWWCSSAARSRAASGPRC